MVVPSSTVAKIVALVEDGRSQRYASRTLGVPETTVRRVLQRYRETGQMTRRPGSGRPRATQPADDRFIVLQTRRNHFQSAAETTQRLQEARNTRISVDTVRRRLAEAHLYSRVPATGPLLTPAHRQARLTFAREYGLWTTADWARVMFSDESRFVLYSSDRRNRVWRSAGERYAQSNIAEQVPFGGGSVMVWGGIALEAKTDLHVFRDGSLNAQRYITDILEQYVAPFAHDFGDEFLFMHDNARPHTANIVREYLGEAAIGTLEWPARSPDLNPIEHLWDQLGRRVRRQPNPPFDLTQLGDALVEAWEEIEQDAVSSLIRSMPRRLQAVIQARGGNTRY